MADNFNVCDVAVEASAAALAALTAGAPAALNTLDELAAALGDDASYAATITTALGNKQPLDADLTAIAALATTAYGRALLTTADAAALAALTNAYLPWRVEFDPLIWEAATLVGPWARLIDATQSYAAYVRNSNASQNDANGFSDVFSAGTWSFSVIGLTAGDAPILTLQVDGVDEAGGTGTFDQYSASTTRNAVSTRTGVVLTAGKHVINFVAATKHASSAGYQARVSKVIAWRTA